MQGVSTQWILDSVSKERGYPTITSSADELAIKLYCDSQSFCSNVHFSALEYN